MIFNKQNQIHPVWIENQFLSKKIVVLKSLFFMGEKITRYFSDSLWYPFRNNLEFSKEHNLANYIHEYLVEMDCTGFSAKPISGRSRISR